jgi:hypothetical protein
MSIKNISVRGTQIALKNDIRLRMSAYAHTQSSRAVKAFLLLCCLSLLPNARLDEISQGHLVKNKAINRLSRTNLPTSNK